jgi:WD40 repeat protein
VFSDVREPIDHLALSPDGHTLAAAGGGTIHLWDLRTMQPLEPFYPLHPVVRALTFAPDGRLVAVGGDHQVRFLNLDKRWVDDALSAPVGAWLVIVSPDQRTLIVAGTKEATIWGALRARGPWLWLRTEHTPVRGACFSPAGDEMVLARDREVDGWSLTDRNHGPQVRWVGGLSSDDYHLIHFNADGRLSTFAGDSLGLLDQQAAEAEVIRDLDCKVACPRFAPDGSCFAGLDGYSVVLEPIERDAAGCRREPAPRQPLTALAFSPDGHTLAVAARDGTVYLWPWRRLLAS